jgi:hypothetical protein
VCLAAGAFRWHRASSCSDRLGSVSNRLQIDGAKRLTSLLTTFRRAGSSISRGYGKWVPLHGPPCFRHRCWRTSNRHKKRSIASRAATWIDRITMAVEIVVAALAASAAAGTAAAIASTCRRTSSAASRVSDRIDHRPIGSRLRHSLPSTNPISDSPWRNPTTTGSYLPGGIGLRNSTTGTACCCAASGHVATTPPRNNMNSRRLMSDSAFPWRHSSVHDTLNLLQKGRQVLGADLNDFESRWAAAI